jgi:transposase
MKGSTTKNFFASWYITGQKLKMTNKILTLHYLKPFFQRNEHSTWFIAGKRIAVGWVHECRRARRLISLCDVFIVVAIQMLRV